MHLILRISEFIYCRAQLQLVLNRLIFLSPKIRFVSAIQAIVSFIIGLYVIQCDCRSWPWTSRSVILTSYTWFGTGYFVYDIIHMYRVYDNQCFEQEEIDPKKEISFSDRISIFCQDNAMIIVHHVFLATLGLFSVAVIVLFFIRKKKQRQNQIRFKFSYRFIYFYSTFIDST